jgi:hypothetical protein
MTSKRQLFLLNFMLKALDFIGDKEHYKKEFNLLRKDILFFIQNLTESLDKTN